MPIALLSLTSAPQDPWLSQDALGDPQALPRPLHPSAEESQLTQTLPFAHLARSHRWSLVTEAFGTLGTCYLLPFPLIPLALWGRGNVGAKAATWGPQGDVG